MKKYITYGILVILSLINIPNVYASTLYSNDFKTNYPTFNNFYSNCGVTSQGLSCNAGVGIYNIAFPTIQCLSSSINVTSAYANLLFFTGSSVSDDLGLEIKSGQNMRVLKTVSGVLTGYDIGKQPELGWQNFKICQDTNSLTTYYNDVLVYTLPFSHSIYPYVGFYLDPNVVLTNFIITDSSSINLYSNDFKTIYGTFNTFYNTCNSSNQGLTCNGSVGEYGVSLPNLQCLSSSINVTSAYANLLFFTTPAIGDSLGLEIKSGQNMRVLKNVNGILTGYDTGQQPSSGWQNFMICQNTSSFSAYNNNVHIYTLTFNHSIYPYVGFYLDPNVVLTNFVATDTLPITPSLMPTPTPTPTLTPTPTPTPKKVIIVPGLGGSWNTGALLSCSLSNSTDNGWIITPTFGTSVYEPLYTNLQQSGYEPSYFTYDWRKNMQITSARLSAVLTSLAPGNEKVDVIGHSLGGLVGTTYLQSVTEASNKISKFLAVAAPFGGAVGAYPAWSAGEIWTDDLRIRIAMTFVIESCGRLHSKTNRDMVRELMPSFGNLLPRFPYLIDTKTGLFKIPVDAQNTLPITPLTNPYRGTTLGTLAGQGFDTLSTLTVKNPSVGDLKYTNWLDGKPIQTSFSLKGDGTVLSQSEMIDGIPAISLSLNHTGLMNDPAGIAAIRAFLGALPLTALTRPQTAPQSALVVVAYPSSLLVTDPALKIHKDIQSMVGFVNPKNGSYRLLIMPSSDTTRLIIAQFLPNGKNLWKEYELKNRLPKIKTIKFDADNPLEDPIR